MNLQASLRGAVGGLSTLRSSVGGICKRTMRSTPGNVWLALTLCHSANPNHLPSHWHDRWGQWSYSSFSFANFRRGTDGDCLSS